MGAGSDFLGPAHLPLLILSLSRVLDIRRELLLFARSVVERRPWEEKARFRIIVDLLCFCALVCPFGYLILPGLLGIARYSYAERITCTSTELRAGRKEEGDLGWIG